MWLVRYVVVGSFVVGGGFIVLGVVFMFMLGLVNMVFNWFILVVLMFGNYYLKCEKGKIGWCNFVVK